MVPKNAGQSLKAVTIAQAKNVETVKFDVSSKAFVGDRLTASSEIRLASVGGEQSANLGEATIVFDQPAHLATQLQSHLPFREILVEVGFMSLMSPPIQMGAQCSLKNTQSGNVFSVLREGLGEGFMSWVEE